MSDGTISKGFYALLMIGVLIPLGFFLFPGLKTIVDGVDTTGFGNILSGEHALIPYALIAAVFIGVLALINWAKR